MEIVSLVINIVLAAFLVVAAIIVFSGIRKKRNSRSANDSESESPAGVGFWFKNTKGLLIVSIVLSATIMFILSQAFSSLPDAISWIKMMLVFIPASVPTIAGVVYLVGHKREKLKKAAHLACKVWLYAFAVGVMIAVVLAR